MGSAACAVALVAAVCEAALVVVAAACAVALVVRAACALPAILVVGVRKGAISVAGDPKATPTDPAGFHKAADLATNGLRISTAPEADNLGPDPSMRSMRADAVRERLGRRGFPEVRRVVLPPTGVETQIVQVPRTVPCRVVASWGIFSVCPPMEACMRRPQDVGLGPISAALSVIPMRTCACTAMTYVAIFMAETSTLAIGTVDILTPGTRRRGPLAEPGQLPPGRRWIVGLPTAVFSLCTTTTETT